MNRSDPVPNPGLAADRVWWLADEAVILSGATMSAEHDDYLTSEIERFAQTLLDRLQQRPGARNGAQRLDLRHADFANRGYVTLRNPASPGWPERGATTTQKGEAERWVRKSYAELLLRKLRPELFPARVRPRTVAAALDDYIRWLTAEKGEGHNTTLNRRSHAEVHIKPALGSLPFDADFLTRARVTEFLGNLQVTVSKYRSVTKAPAAPGMIDAVRDTLRATWVHHFPEIAPPFGGIKLARARRRQAEVEAIKAGEVGLGHAPVSYTYEELVRILVAAMWYDQHAIVNIPNVRVTTVPNSAHAIAMQTANAMRINELMYWRWKHVHRAEGCIWIPGTKNETAARWAPLQLSLIPWLDAAWKMRVNHGERPAPSSFVITSRWNPKPDHPSGDTTYQGRAALILLLAGLKIPGKATHPFRATHITWGERSSNISHEQIQGFVGHATALGKVTRLYVDRRPIFIAPEHRQYIKLPTPAEIARFVPSFEPSIGLDAARQLAKRNPGP